MASSPRVVNISLPEEVYQAAKDGAARKGCFFRKWVEEAILEKHARDGRQEVAHELRKNRGVQ